MILTGRIFDIVKINDKVAQLVLKKKMNDKIVPVAVSIFGYWKTKALEEMKVKLKDKIRGKLYLKSKIYNGKYYTDVFFKEIHFAEDVRNLINEGLFTDTDSVNDGFIETDDGIIDAETGELL
jgi:hypothetical protein